MQSDNAKRSVSFEQYVTIWDGKKAIHQEYVKDENTICQDVICSMQIRDTDFSHSSNTVQNYAAKASEKMELG